MNTTKKLLLTAGIFFQMSAVLFADAWSNAFDAFGGVEYVYSHRGSLPYSQCQKKAASLGNTPEALAVGMFMSEGTDAVLVPRFKGAASRAEVIDALNETINQARSVQVPAAQPAQVAQPAQQAASRGWMDWLSAGSAAQDQSAVSATDIQNAVQAQQDADAAAAAKSNQALADLVNSGATGLNLYKGYIDLIFNLLQQAVNAIVEPAVQQQVIGYAQNKLAGMKASAAAANRYQAKTLGRMNSKKVAKKSGNKKS
jgi:hypothetical protein